MVLNIIGVIANLYDGDGVIQHWVNSSGEGLSVAHHHLNVRVSHLQVLMQLVHYPSTQS